MEKRKPPRKQGLGAGNLPGAARSLSAKTSAKALACFKFWRSNSANRKQIFLSAKRQQFLLSASTGAHAAIARA